MLPPDPSWPKPPAPPPLTGDAIHVWRLDLTAPHDDTALTADERERAARFLSLPARGQFVAARSALRRILAGYLRCEADGIAFRLGTVGKPALADPGAPPLYFNLSHSHALGLLAITHFGEIGVDVELVRDRDTAPQLAERFFHPNEVAALQGLPPEQRTAAFFNAWTRKEAFLKATGKGITYGIDRVEVTLAPNTSARVLTLDGDPNAAAAWSLMPLAPAADYIAALALRGSRGSVSRFSF